MADARKIVAGTLLITTDNFLLAPFGGGPALDLALQGALATSLDDRLDRHPVSVLGLMGERAIDASSRVPSLHAESIVSQAKIAERAFARHEANPTVTALDNWLRAERELLESGVALTGRPTRL